MRVATTILNATLCVECMADKAGLSIPRVREVLKTIAQATRIIRQRGSCAMCSVSTNVYTIA